MRAPTIDTVEYQQWAQRENDRAVQENQRILAEQIQFSNMIAEAVRLNTMLYGHTIAYLMFAPLERAQR